jgi:hypothetical protein
MQKRRDDYKRKKMQREFNETVTAPLNIVEHQSVILGNHQNLIVLPYVQCSMVLVNSKKVGSVGTHVYISYSKTTSCEQFHPIGVVL